MCLVSKNRLQNSHLWLLAHVCGFHTSAYCHSPFGRILRMWPEPSDTFTLARYSYTWPGCILYATQTTSWLISGSNVSPQAFTLHAQVAAQSAKKWPSKYSQKWFVYMFNQLLQTQKPKQILIRCLYKSSCFIQTLDVVIYALQKNGSCSLSDTWKCECPEDTRCCRLRMFVWEFVC